MFIPDNKGLLDMQIVDEDGLNITSTHIGYVKSDLANYFFRKDLAFKWGRLTEDQKMSIYNRLLVFAENKPFSSIGGSPELRKVLPLTLYLEVIEQEIKNIHKQQETS